MANKFKPARITAKNPSYNPEAARLATQARLKGEARLRDEAQRAISSEGRSGGEQY